LWRVLFYCSKTYATKRNNWSAGQLTYALKLTVFTAD
jgi:hypothetical protein